MIERESKSNTGAIVFMTFLVIAVIGGFFLNDKATENATLQEIETAKEAKALRLKKVQMAYQQTETRLKASLAQFYSKCFSVKRYSCSYGGSPVVVVKFNNRTRHRVEAVLMGLTVSDKLGNTITSEDLILTKGVSIQENVDVPFQLSWEAAALSPWRYVQDDLGFSFSTPQARVSRPGNESYRSNDVIVRFSDGMTVHDYSDWIEGYDVELRMQEMEKQMEYLRLY